MLYPKKAPEIHKKIERKILNKSKGALKLLDKGDLSYSIKIEISYASKKAIEKIEKLGGSVKITTKSN